MKLRGENPEAEWRSRADQGVPDRHPATGTQRRSAPPKRLQTRSEAGSGGPNGLEADCGSGPKRQAGNGDPPRRCSKERSHGGERNVAARCRLRVWRQVERSGVSIRGGPKAVAGSKGADPHRAYLPCFGRVMTAGERAELDGRLEPFLFGGYAPQGAFSFLIPTAPPSPRAPECTGRGTPPALPPAPPPRVPRCGCSGLRLTPLPADRALLS